MIGMIGMVTRQKTLGTLIDCRGVGLHSGFEAGLVLKPADVNSGIRIVRTDLMNGAREIVADWRGVSSTRLATTVANDHGASVGTIEHLMAALAGCEIDNVVVEIGGPEIPAMDGSAAPFVSLIERAGIVEQDAARRTVKILKPVSVGDDARSVSIVPAERFSIDFEIAFAETVIDRQRYRFEPAAGGFRSEISRARTFGMEKDIHELQRNGYGRGGSLGNTVVVGAGGVLNEGGLRYRDEFVRHKILDCLGDLYLAGAPLLGAVRAYRSGHELNNRLLRTLFADETAWTMVDAAAPGESVIR